MLISLIIPAHNEATQIPHTLTKLQEVLDSNYEYEFIFIDDGSTDESWQILKACLEAEPRLKILKLSRNFGKEAALACGLDAISPDSQAAIILDCDLQFPPEYIKAMLEHWRAGYQIVAGRKSHRQKESWGAKIKAKFFYKIFDKLTGFELKNSSDFQLWDRAVIEAWYKLSERELFFRGFSQWLGFKRHDFEFTVADREHGQSSWNFFSLLKLSISAITSFSAKILLLIPLMAAVLWLFFLILGIQTLLHFFRGESATGFTTVILLQLMIGGATLLALSLLAVYIAKLFNEVKSRPRYIVSEFLRGDD
ncbi:MAG: glycosyltransferase family 2 protein [Eubacteriales bacterium]|nr:glycosyltransferase family 2 protein [Eubacteriales bacterium]